MYQLRKLSRIKNYRAYSNFTWDEEVPPFNNNNFIFGWNASGKSSIADLLLSLSSNQQFEDSIEFNFLFQDEAFHRLEVSNDKTHSDKYSLFIFDQNYTDRNIEKTDTLKHIYAIGESQVNIASKLKEKQANIEKCVADRNRAEEILVKAQKQFEQLLTKNASALKNELLLGSSYNKNNFLAEFEACAQPKKVSSERYDILYKTITTTGMQELAQFQKSQINESMKQFIHELLSSQPVIIAIDTYKEHNDVANWASEGLVLHDKYQTKNCLFCGSNISEDRYAALTAHFNQSFKDLNDKIQKSIDRFTQYRDIYVQLQNTQYNANQFYPELRERYTIAYENFNKKCQRCLMIIDTIIKILESKRTNLVSNEALAQFDSIPDISLLSEDILFYINELVSQNNIITNNFKLVVENARNELKQNWFALYLDEVNKQKSIKDAANKEFSTASVKLQNAVDEKASLIKESSSVSLPASVMNEELARFLGRDEIQFIEQENGYVLMRNGSIAKNLSKGEKNAISLVYFLNTLQDVSVQIKDTIVVLDDPISSFDSNYYYYALSYIRIYTEDIGQLFIFTHKFSFYKDLCKVFKDTEARHYIIERDQSGIHLKKECRFICKYYDEYLYLFAKIINYARSNSPSYEESLVIANLARKVLESYLTFKVPNHEEGIDKVRVLSGGLTVPARAMCRILNSKSHLQIIPDQDRGDDLEIINVMQESIRDMLQFMLKNDELHFKTLLENCDIEPTTIIIDGNLVFTSPSPS